MQVSLDKSKLCAKAVEFLDFLLMQTGHQPVRKWIEAGLKTAHPRNTKKVRWFLGTINFVKNHIPNHSEIMAPITELTKKDVPFVWEEEQAAIFNNTKTTVSNAIMCTIPDPNKFFMIYPDLSQK